MSDSLDTIGQRHQTDKASVFTRTYAKPHDYLRHMEKFFSPMRLEPIRFLEIGVGGGESIRTWLEYFLNATIYGIDIVHSTNSWNTPGLLTDERYFFTAGDQSDSHFWDAFIGETGCEWDIVVEDGGHHANQVITTINAMWPHVKSGGLFICEDLACSYSSIFQTPGWPTPIERLRGLIDAMNQGQGDVDSITFSRELAIIRKR